MNTGARGRIDVAVTHFKRSPGAPFYESYRGATEGDWEIHIGNWWIVISRLPHKIQGQYSESYRRSSDHDEDHSSVRGHR